MKVYIVETPWGVDRVFSTRELAEFYVNQAFPNRVNLKQPVSVDEYEVDA